MLILYVLTILTANMSVSNTSFSNDKVAGPNSSISKDKVAGPNQKKTKKSDEFPEAVEYEATVDDKSSDHRERCNVTGDGRDATDETDSSVADMSDIEGYEPRTAELLEKLKALRNMIDARTDFGWSWRPQTSTRQRTIAFASPLKSSRASNPSCYDPASGYCTNTDSSDDDADDRGFTPSGPEELRHALKDLNQRASSRMRASTPWALGNVAPRAQTPSAFSDSRRQSPLDIHDGVSEAEPYFQARPSPIGTATPDTPNRDEYTPSNDDSETGPHSIEDDVSISEVGDDASQFSYDSNEDRGLPTRCTTRLSDIVRDVNEGFKSTKPMTSDFCKGDDYSDVEEDLRYKSDSPDIRDENRRPMTRESSSPGSNSRPLSAAVFEYEDSDEGGDIDGIRNDLDRSGSADAKRRSLTGDAKTPTPSPRPKSTVLFEYECTDDEDNVQKDNKVTGTAYFMDVPCTTPKMDLQRTQKRQSSSTIMSHFFHDSDSEDDVAALSAMKAIPNRGLMSKNKTVPDPFELVRDKRNTDGGNATYLCRYVKGSDALRKAPETVPSFYDHHVCAKPSGVYVPSAVFSADNVLGTSLSQQMQTASKITRDKGKKKKKRKASTLPSTGVIAMLAHAVLPPIRPAQGGDMPRVSPRGHSPEKENFKPATCQFTTSHDRAAEKPANRLSAVKLHKIGDIDVLQALSNHVAKTTLKTDLITAEAGSINDNSKGTQFSEQKKDSNQAGSDRPFETRSIRVVNFRAKFNRQSILLPPLEDSESATRVDKPTTAPKQTRRPILVQASIWETPNHLRDGNTVNSSSETTYNTHYCERAALARQQSGSNTFLPHQTRSLGNTGERQTFVVPVTPVAARTQSVVPTATVGKLPSFAVPIASVCQRTPFGVPTGGVDERAPFAEPTTTSGGSYVGPATRACDRAPFIIPTLTVGQGTPFVVPTVTVGQGAPFEVPNSVVERAPFVVPTYSADQPAPFVVPTSVGERPQYVIPTTSFGERPPFFIPTSSVGKRAPFVVPTTSLGEGAPFVVPTASVGQRAPFAVPTSVGERPLFFIPTTSVGQRTPFVEPTTIVGEGAHFVVPTTSVGEGAPFVVPTTSVGERPPFVVPTTSVGQRAPFVVPTTSVCEGAPFVVPTTSVGHRAPFFVPTTSVGDRAPFTIPTASMTEPKHCIVPTVPFGVTPTFVIPTAPIREKTTLSSRASRVKVPSDTEQQRLRDMLETASFTPKAPVAQKPVQCRGRSARVGQAAGFLKEAIVPGLATPSTCKSPPPSDQDIIRSKFNRLFKSIVGSDKGHPLNKKRSYS